MSPYTSRSLVFVNRTYFPDLTACFVGRATPAHSADAAPHTATDRLSGNCWRSGSILDFPATMRWTRRRDHLWHGQGMERREAVVGLVAPSDEQRCQGLMQAHHYLGALPKRNGTECLPCRRIRSIARPRRGWQQQSRRGNVHGRREHRTAGRWPARCRCSAWARGPSRSAVLKPVARRLSRSRRGRHALRRELSRPRWPWDVSWLLWRSGVAREGARY